MSHGVHTDLDGTTVRLTGRPTVLHLLVLALSGGLFWLGFALLVPPGAAPNPPSPPVADVRCPMGCTFEQICPAATPLHDLPSPGALARRFRRVGYEGGLIVPLSDSRPAAWWEAAPPDERCGLERSDVVALSETQQITLHLFTAVPTSEARQRDVTARVEQYQAIAKRAWMTRRAGQERAYHEALAETDRQLARHESFRQTWWLRFGVWILGVVTLGLSGWSIQVARRPLVVRVTADRIALGPDIVEAVDVASVTVQRDHVSISCRNGERFRTRSVTTRPAQRDAIYDAVARMVRSPEDAWEERRERSRAHDALTGMGPG